MILAARERSLVQKVVLVASVHAGGSYTFIVDPSTGKRRKCLTVEEVQNEPTIKQIAKYVQQRNVKAIQNMFDVHLYTVNKSSSERENREYIEEMFKCRSFMQVTPALNFVDLI